MPISKDDFAKHLQDVCYLIGYTNPPKEQKALFYRKLSEYDLEDFVAACNDDEMIARLSRLRNLDYTIIRETIEKHQMKRWQKNEQVAKRERERNLRELLKDADVPKEVRDFIKNLRKM